MNIVTLIKTFIDVKILFIKKEIEKIRSSKKAA